MEVMTVAQVFAFEDEIKRSMDVKRAQDFTKSETVSELPLPFQIRIYVYVHNALLMHDIYGGKVYGIPLGDGKYYCFNMIDACELHKQSIWDTVV